MDTNTKKSIHTFIQKHTHMHGLLLTAGILIILVDTNADTRALLDRA